MTRTHAARRTLRSRLLAIFATLAVAAVAVGGAVALTPPAETQAATTGYGYQNQTPFGGYLGNYVMSDGNLGYCLDSGADAPLNATGPAGIESGFTTESGDALSASDIAHLVYALEKYGQTSNPDQAAAMSAYVYAFTSNFAHGNGVGVYGSGALYINGDAAITGIYDVIFNDAAANWTPLGAGTGGGTLDFSVDSQNNYLGNLFVNTTTASTGTITLTNGVFISTGTNTLTGAIAGGSYG